MKKVVVFGGCGFIGGHVCEELEERGIKPIVFDRFKKNDLQPMMKRDIYVGDITDANAVNYIVGLAHGAINLAGILGTSETVDNPFPSAHVNIFGALNFLEACRKHKRLGVQIAVGNHFMNNSYSITKTTAERFALMYNQEHDTKIAVVRALNAYGERQKARPVRKIMPNFILPALAGEPIEIFGDGEQVMDMIYVKDVAKILVNALLDNHGIYNSVFEAGTGRNTTVNDIAQEVIKQTSSKAGVKHVGMRQGEPERSVVVGNSKTLQPIFKDKLTTLEDGIKKTVAWYKDNNEVLSDNLNL